MESSALQNAPLCDGRRNRYGAERGAAVSAEQNEPVFRRWIDAYNERDRQAEADARAPGYVAHAPGVPDPLDSDAWEEFIFEVFAEAFPDLRLTIEEIGCSDDTVAARIAFRGTHHGEFQGLPPTNKEVAFTSVEINRMVDGKVAGTLVRVRPGQAVRAVRAHSHTRSPAVAAHPRSSSEEAAPEVAREALRDIDATA
jgi:predicted ester cyclase